MLGFSRTKPIAEYAATGEIERVYHEIKQTLRVSGINLNFRTWAGYGDFLPLMWDAFRPNAETRAFESAADQVRAEAVELAESIGALNVRAAAAPGDSQAYHIRATLDLYHYVNPKLLVLTSAVLQTLQADGDGQELSGGGAATHAERIVRGIPARMAPMEMESEEPDDPKLQQTFNDIKTTLQLPAVNSDYRSLALWPDYLQAAWSELKPVVQSASWTLAGNRLRDTARELARRLPCPIALTPAAVAACGTDVDEIIQVSESFEQLLPGLIINIALLQLDWQSPQDLRRSPFPAQTREAVQES